jgi:hypothetical protein
MKSGRAKTAVRMREARERLDAFEAQEEAGSAPVAPDRKVALIVWLAVVACGLAIYVLFAWYRRH